MQTFVPYLDHQQTAEFLDNRRLFKQLVEGKQILLALGDPEYGWQEHPAVQMWRGNEPALVEYLLVLAVEWRRRGLDRGTGEEYRESITEWLHDNYSCETGSALPEWWGGPIHESHILRLFWKEPEWYGPILFGETWEEHVLRDEPDYWWPTNNPLTKLYPHQKDAVKRLGNGKVLWGGVGSGKSLTVLAYYMQKEAPKDIVVITTVKKRDKLEWEREAIQFGISPIKEISRAGSITVDSWNNISKYADCEDCFFIFDEQRLVGNGTWAKAFQKIARRNRWVLLSATPGDTWMDYAQVFIANGLYQNLTQFRREHVVYVPFSKYPKIQRYLSVDQLERYRNMILVEMPHQSHTTRHVEDVLVEFDAALVKKLETERWNYLEDRPILDSAELFRLMRKAVYSDPSRYAKVKELLVRHPRLVLFYNFDFELEILRGLRNEGIMVAEWNGHRKEPIPETDSWVYLVQYTAGAEGWNCVETDSMVFYSLTYSYKVFEQAQGRIDRINTPYEDLWYFVLLADTPADRAVQRALKGKKKFNEKAYLDKIYGDFAA